MILSGAHPFLEKIKILASFILALNSSINFHSKLIEELSAMHLGMSLQMVFLDPSFTEFIKLSGVTIFRVPFRT